MVFYYYQQWYHKEKLLITKKNFAISVGLIFKRSKASIIRGNDGEGVSEKSSITNKRLFNFFSLKLLKLTIFVIYIQYRGSLNMCLKIHK